MEAILFGEVGTIEDLIQEIASEHPQLAHLLLDLVENFQFETLLAAL